MSRKKTDLKYLLLKAVKLALEAGQEIMTVYQKADFDIEMKDDNSPLTLADKASHLIITRGVEGLGIPVLSEEGLNIGWETRKNWERYWLIDPLDGTKEFIKRNDEFTVNIALMGKNMPVLGVIYLPVLKKLYFALKNHGAFRLEDPEQFTTGDGFDKLTEMSVRLPLGPESTGIKLVASRSHLSVETKNFIRNLEERGEKITMVAAGSSLKLCLIAEGSADVYPRMGPTMEWDIAAGHIIIDESGGSVLKIDNNPLNYNKPDLLNPWFIAKSKFFQL